jgi:glyoxylase-like metal-dependent hydrolase (beta-lactamase superfamily II)
LCLLVVAIGLAGTSLLMALSMAIPCLAAPVAALQMVAPNVYVALQPFSDRFNDSNSTIIILDDGVLVVDTQTTLTATRAVLDQIREVTARPVRWVVNTHWHGDHVQGNQVYREAFPGVQFIAQANTRDDMASRATVELSDSVAGLPMRIEKYRKMLADGRTPDGRALTGDDRHLLEMRISTFSAQLPDLLKTHIVLPDVTFDSALSLYSGSREVRLSHYAGHTRGDAVVFLPKEKILITGDLLDDLPFTGDGSPAALVKTLHEIDRMDFDIIIPGHGAIERSREHLHQVTQLFESIVSQVDAAVRAGLSVEDTKAKVNVEEYRAPLTHGEEHAMRAFDGFVPAAIERAYQEAATSAMR